MRGMKNASCSASKYFLLLPFLILVLLFSGRTFAATTDIYTLGVSGTCRYSVGSELLGLINQKRTAQNGTESRVPEPLKLDRDLTMYAMQRAAECSVDFSHTRPDGTANSTISEKLDDEIIGRDYSTPRDMFNDLQRQPDLFKKLMDPEIKSVGISCFRTEESPFNNKSYNYWVITLSRSEAENQPESGDIHTTLDVRILEGSQPLTARMSDYSPIVITALEAGSTHSIAVGRVNPRLTDRTAAFIPQSFDWSSSDEKVARIDGPGVVAMISAGEAIISFTPKFCESTEPPKMSINIRVQESLERARIEIIEPVMYNGEQHRPKPAVMLNDKLLEENVDFTYRYGPNTDAGIEAGTVYVDGIGFYHGTVSTLFDILPVDVTDRVDISLDEWIFNGAQTTTEEFFQSHLRVVWKEDGTPLPKKSFKIKEVEISPAGHDSLIEKFTIEFINNYTGIRTLRFIGRAYMPPIISQFYTGKEIRPEIKLYADSALLSIIPPEEYKVSYENNVNAGKALIHILGTGNWYGKLEEQFIIVPEDMGNVSIFMDDDQTYTGKQITPEVSCKLNDTLLVEDVDYTVEYGTNVDAGEGTIVVTGQRNFEGVCVIEFVIKPRDIAKANVPPIGPFVYDGEPIEPYPRLYDSELMVSLIPERDYKVSYEKNVDAGEALIIVTGIGNYGGSMNVPFVIEPEDIALAVIQDGYKDQIFTGAPITMALLITLNGRELTLGKDYEITWDANVNVGQVLVTLNGIGNYEGRLEKAEVFHILPREISDTQIAAIPDQTWTGSEITPPVDIHIGEVTVTPEMGYKLSYTGNIEPGTASILITGFDNMKGEAKVSFIITKDISKAEAEKMPSFVYDGKAKEPEPVIKDKDYTLVAGTDYTLSYEKNTDAGEAQVIATGTGHYSGTLKIPFMIEPADISKVKISEGIKDQVYTGLPIITPLYVTFNGMELTLGKDYTTAWTSNINVGPVYVTLTGIGNYQGTLENFKPFSVIQRYISDSEIAGIPDQTYTGSQITPPVEIRIGETVLTPEMGYELSYTSNIEPGTATVTITGINNMKGVTTTTFNITKKEDPAPGTGSGTGEPGNTSDSGSSGAPGSEGLGDISGSAGGGMTDVYGNAIVSETQMEQQILALGNDNDPSWSTYSLLQAKLKKAKKTSITITWKRVPGATQYVIYGNKCGRGKRYERIAAVPGTSFTQKKLKSGTYYKYLVVATGSGNALATSKTLHIATAGGKVGNDKSIKVNKSNITLRLKKKGKNKFKLTAKGIANGIVKRHRAISFETSDPKIAVVSKKGVIKAVARGRCKIYVYSQDGVMKAVTVKVK